MEPEKSPRGGCRHREVGRKRSSSKTFSGEEPGYSKLRPVRREKVSDRVKPKKRRVGLIMKNWRQELEEGGRR